MKIAFIGLGIMGRPMAGHLLDGGHDLYLHDLRPVPQNLLEKGAPCLPVQQGSGGAG